MVDFLKFFLSFKGILVAVAIFFIGEQAVQKILDDSKAQAEAQTEQLKEDIDNVGLEEAKGIVGKVKEVSEKVKHKVYQLLMEIQEDSKK